MVQAAQTLRVLDLEILNEDPFKYDRFERQQEIENLTTLLQNYPAPAVVAIDGQWGAGKTTFIRLWQAWLKSLDEPQESIHLNAWECDFSDDPLIPLLAQIDVWLKKKQDLPQKAKSSLRDVKRVLPALARPIARATVKALTLNAVDTDELLEAVSPEAAVELADQLLSQFNSEASAIEVFKKSLGDCLECLPDYQPNLIIFIDELDRCRPSFAIELLERVKHLFDIKRVVFVLSVNKDQLAKSISGVYGERFDGLTYLKRFIDIDYHLTVPSSDAFVLNALRKSLVHDYCATRLSDGQSQYGSIEAIFKWYVSKYSLPPREVHQLIKRFGIVVASIDRDIPMNTILLTVMYLLRNSDFSLYSSLPSRPDLLIDVVKWMYGENLAQTSFPGNAYKVMAWLAISEFDPYTGGEQNLTEDFIRRQSEAQAIRPQCAAELNQFVSFIDDLKTRVRFEENVRQSCFNQIEKLKHFKV